MPSSDDSVDSSHFGDRLRLPEFPRAATYNPPWLIENSMGPNPVWLVESLAGQLDLGPGLRVLDLGCGKAISSIFLAKEFGVQVWATDLWISASENWARVEQASMGDLVIPIRAEAHALPFASGFFDLALSFDAYHYFGTDDLYVAYLAPFLKVGGTLGIVVPGLQAELPGDPPEWVLPYWDPSFRSFHSPSWWRDHLDHSGVVHVQSADLIPDGWRHWLAFNEVCDEYLAHLDRREADMLRIDAGRTFGFTRVVAQRL